MVASDSNPEPGRADDRDGRIGTLIERWLDRVIEPDELVEMEAALRESSQVRTEFWDRSLLHGLLFEAAKTTFGLSAPRRPAAAKASRIAFPWLANLVGGVALLVGGCGIGSLAVSYAGWGANHGIETVVCSEGFESGRGPERKFLPTSLDQWGGDQTVVVGEERGVRPRSGERMLRFVAPQSTVDSGQNVCEIWRYIDIEDLRAAAGAGPLRAVVSAFFNDADAENGPTAFHGLSVVVTDCDPRTLDGQQWVGLISKAALRPEAMAAAQVRERFDGSRKTWQRVSASVTVPEKARYLVVHCFAELRRPNVPQIEARARGRYVDDITIGVEPYGPNRSSLSHKAYKP
jgi:hypothetical protein